MTGPLLRLTHWRGHPVWVNASRIQWFDASDDGTRVFFGRQAERGEAFWDTFDHELHVRESPDVIAAMLATAGVAVASDASSTAPAAAGAEVPTGGSGA